MSAAAFIRMLLTVWAGIGVQLARIAGMPYILAQRAVPVILPSSGSSNATGQITHTTALPYQPSGTVQVRLPAGVVTAGSQGTGAGLYSAIYSSATVCQIQGTGIVTANAAYTQTTATDITLATVPVPGGTIGANGSVRSITTYSMANTAGNKTFRQRLGGTQTNGFVVPSQATLQMLLLTRNRGAQNVQASVTNLSGIGVTTNAVVQNTVDTSVSQDITFQGQLATATDFIILDGYTVEVLPAA